mmetsp:Transcript_36820/g.50712  ORF Transcript_36820/g.50712 Transcript_36820/m.50712 type:complete len:98 (-) Transcript_36820:581-874(-)
MNIDNLKAWLHQVEKYAFGDAIRVIIRNKIDLYEHGGVSTEEVQSLADDLNIQFFEVSAKTGEGVDRAFNGFIFQYLKERNLVPEMEGVAIKKAIRG